MIATTHRAPDTVVPVGRLAFWVMTAVGIAGAVVLYLVDPTTASLFPACPFHALTGLHCPGCGTSRALHQLLHFDVVAALNHNILSTLFVPVVAWAWASQGLQSMGRKPLPSIPWTRSMLWALVFVLLVFWIGRNIPVFPLTLLAP